MFKKISLIMVVCTLITGCASIRVERPGEFDANFKTICIPPGYDMLKGDVKRALKADGWTIYSISRGKDITSVTEKKLETEWDPRARYRLLINYYQVDVDILFRPLYNFTISILDNKTGEEVIAVDGTYATGAAVVSELRKQLR